MESVCGCVDFYNGINGLYQSSVKVSIVQMWQLINNFVQGCLIYLLTQLPAKTVYTAACYWYEEQMTQDVRFFYDWRLYHTAKIFFHIIDREVLYYHKPSCY